MKTFKITLSLFLVIILFSNKVIAQQNPSGQPLIDKFSVGLNFGSLLTYGDIKEYNFWPAPAERKWGFGGNVNYQISPIFSLQLQGTIGKLAGIKRYFTSGEPANLKFNADINEGDIVATISLNRWWAPNLKINNKVNFYMIAGIGLVNFRSQLRGLYDDHFIKSFGYSSNGTVKEKMTTETSFPAGLGIKYKVSKKIDIALESTLRYVVTDKLDAYVRPTNFNDKYGYTSIGVIYKFGKQEKHMEWIEPKEVEKDTSKVALAESNKKIDEMNKRIAELESKKPAASTTGADDQKIAAINQKIDDLTKKVNELENKGTGTGTVANTTGGGNIDLQKLADLAQKVDELNKKVNELENRGTGTGTVTNNTSGGNIDLQKLAELNQKLTDLDNKNKELGSKIINMQTSNVTYTGGKPILVSVFFDVNKTNIDKINGQRIASAAKYLKSDPSAKLELVGNADRTGGQKYNELLSERRAKVVQQTLVNEYGIDASRLTVSFKGYSEPLSKNNLSVNRRVDFLIK